MNIMRGGAEGEIKITRWSLLDFGFYHFHGTDPEGGDFYADARLEFRGSWRATVETSTSVGDRDSLIAAIVA